MVRSYFTALLVFFSTFVVNAKDRLVIDSLKAVIESAINDTIKIKALHEWDNLIYASDPELDLELNLRILQLSETNLKNALTDSEQKFYRKSLAASYNNIGIIYKRQADFPLALDFYIKSLKIKEELGNKPGMANTYNNIGTIYQIQSDFPLALDYYFKSLNIEEELSNKRGMARTYNNIGIVYHGLSNYPQALNYYFKSVSLMEDLNDTLNTLFAITYKNIGEIYRVQSFYPQSFDYFFKSLQIEKELGNKKGMAGSYSCIGSLFASLYKYIEDEGQLPADTPDGSIAQEFDAWFAEIPIKLLDTSLYYQQQSLLINEELGDRYYVTYDLSGIASVFMQKGEYRHALEYYHKSALLADSIGALQQESESYLELALCYEKLDEYKNALYHHIQYSILNDSIFNQDKSKELGKLEAKHDFETAEAERKRIEIEELRILHNQKSRRDNLQYSGILIFIVLLFTAVFFIARLSIPIRLAEGMIFFSFLLFFEFTLVLLDPFIEQYSSGAPAIKLGFNALLAGLIFPLHSFFETKLKDRIFP